MAALLNRGSILQEFELESDALDVPDDIYVRFLLKVVKQSILPRRLVIQSKKAGIEIIANKGKMVSFQQFGEKNGSSEGRALPVSEKNTLGILEKFAGDALKDGQVSLHVLSAKELRDLDVRPTPKSRTKKDKATTVVSIKDWKNTKSSGAKESVSSGSPAIEAFAEGIRRMVTFLYHANRDTDQVDISGSSDVLDEGTAEQFWPELSVWNTAISGVLSNSPKLIASRSHSSSKKVQIFATEGNQYLIAEMDANKFGVIVSSWNTATTTTD